MIARVLAISLIAAVAAHGGSMTRNELPNQFRFISHKTTLRQVIDRLGPYTRVRGSGVQAFEYDLPDGSAVLIFPEHPFQPSNKIRDVQFYPKKEQISIYP